LLVNRDKNARNTGSQWIENRAGEGATGTANRGGSRSGQLLFKTREWRRLHPELHGELSRILLVSREKLQVKSGAERGRSGGAKAINSGMKVRQLHRAARICR